MAMFGLAPLIFELLGADEVYQHGITTSVRECTGITVVHIGLLSW